MTPQERERQAAELARTNEAAQQAISQDHHEKRTRDRAFMFKLLAIVLAIIVLGGALFVWNITRIAP